MAKLKQQKKSYNKSKESKLYLLPLILIAFVPVIMYYHQFDTKLDSYPWFGIAWQADVFLYFKMVALILISIVMAVGIAFRYYGIRTSSMSQLKKKKELEIFHSIKIWIPMMIYAVLCILSTVFSEYAYWGIHGMAQQMEPIWVLLGYIIIAYYAYVSVRSSEDLYTVIKWTLISSAIVAAIGAFQAFGLDFYKSIVGKYTYLPPTLVHEDIDFVFEKGRSYSSLYNPNYVGAFACLLIPILIVLIMTNKNRKLLILHILLLAAVIISLFGSGSKAGMICTALAIILLAVLFRKQLMKKWKLVIAGVVLLCVAFVGINALKGNMLIESLSNALNTAKTEQPPLSRIETNDDNVTIVYNGNTLIYRYNETSTSIEDQFALTDQDGNDIAVSKVDDTTLAIQDDRFPNFTVGLATYENLYFGNIVIDGKSWYFTNENGDGTYYYLTITGKLDKIEQPDTDGLFEGRETLASNRGYIWSRSIPLLKKYILLGSGADSFMLVYPNDEYVGKSNYGYGEQNISKPHNLYLQIGVQTGVVSVIAFIVFYLMYFISSIRLYIKSELSTYEAQIGAALLAGTFGYMVAGISNDSCITIAPLFWLFIGLGMAINYHMRKDKINNG